MLLAFQRDDSTGFTKSPRCRQHRGEMGENGCACSAFSQQKVFTEKQVQSALFVCCLKPL